MTETSQESDLRNLVPLVADLFIIQASYRQKNSVSLSLEFRGDRDRSISLLKERLKLAGYSYRLDVSDDTVILSVDPKRRLRIPGLNIVLFIATLISVYFLSVLYRKPSLEETLSSLARGEGIEFTVALISILLVHEMGHFIASRRRRIITSWPYFIPAPNIIGTFGAIIKSKTPFWNRRDLIEVGAAGPIAGWIVAIGWLVYGFSQSSIMPLTNPLMIGIPFTLEGESLLVLWLAPLVIGPLPVNHVYLFTEAAFAGWVGMLVTAINMLPIGQLDGGHIVYGMWRRAQPFLGWTAVGLLGVLGFQSVMWWIFAGFGLFFGVRHPSTLDDSREPGKAALIMGVIALLILVVSFTPVPFRVALFD